ncbi:hypothetical protein [Klebsiella aerogenes]|uniref:hypothetical protein n=1 Tax=Klebsiella aerogenes TaxID=548 RepID=UPI002A807555|nr:hypothetical protein [Klebsiella aerogenes]WPR87925.1 hypothetical protein SM788_25775 [Klebsiella aerogenes]
MLLIQGAKNKSGKVVFQKETESIDRSTGELTKTVEESIVRFNKEPPYIKMYIEDLCAIANAPNSLKDVLLLSLRKLDYDGYINLSTRYRKQMCIELGIKDGTLRNRLSQLVKRGFIESVGGNEYLANPNLFARGEWKDIVEQRIAFEMRIRYMPDGEKILSTAQVEISE